MLTFNSKIASNERPMNGVLHTAVPKLLVAWDTETTGTDSGTDKKEGSSEPISYGLVAYRNGVEEAAHHFLSQPTSYDLPRDSGAYRVHGMSPEDLDDSYAGSLIRSKDGTVRTPALHPHVALDKMLATLAHYQSQGAVFLGHNLDFDYRMLHRAHRMFYGRARQRISPQTGSNLPILASSGFDIDAAKARTIDTYAHAKAMNEFGPPIKRPPSGLTVQLSDGTRIENAVQDYQGNWTAPNENRPSQSLESLCKLYGIVPGGHDALEDSRAAAQLFFAQVGKNRGGR